MIIENVPSPFNPNNKIALNIDETIIKEISSVGSSIKIFQVFYNIAGRLPVVNCAGHHEKNSGIVDDSKGILDTHAVFQGIKRPQLTEDKDGDDSVFVYIVAPKYYYTYIADMVCVAKRKKFPAGTLFAIYVRLNKDGITGEAFNWELIKCDGNNPMLPENYSERYDEERWIK